MVTLEEKFQEKILNVELGHNHINPLITVITKNGKSRHCLPT